METTLEFRPEDHRDELRNNLIFSGLSDSEIFALLEHCRPRCFSLTAGEVIHIEPGFRHRLCLVLSGNVIAYAIGYDGGKTMLNSVKGSGQMGAMQFTVDQYNTVVELTASADSRAIMIEPEKLLIADEKLAIIQHKALVNLMASQRQLFFDLSDHIICLSQKNVRDKILRFLKLQSERARSYEFEIHYSREELAIYLAVDRASLSRSLGELRRDGVIDFSKNRFKILSTKYFVY